MVERHLISRHHAFGKGPRGAVIAQKEFFTAMINEEDHLRLQILIAYSLRLILTESPILKEMTF